MKRATIKDITEYTWFKHELPNYLFPDPDEDEATTIDGDAVKVVCDKFNVRLRIGSTDEQFVLKALI